MFDSSAARQPHAMQPGKQCKSKGCRQVRVKDHLLLQLLLLPPPTCANSCLKYSYSSLGRMLQQGWKPAGAAAESEESSDSRRSETPWHQNCAATAAWPRLSINQSTAFLRTTLPATPPTQAHLMGASGASLPMDPSGSAPALAMGANSTSSVSTWEGAEG